MEDNDKIISEERSKILVAIALQYKAEEGVPKIIAKGYGDIAFKMIEFAKNNGIQIRSDQELATMLAVLDINDFIPYEAYKVVAEIIHQVLMHKTA